MHAHRYAMALTIGLAVATTARAGDLEGELALDGLGATSRHEGPGAGPEEGLASTELGMRLRLALREVDDRLRVEVDYHGREPVGGAFRDERHRLLYALVARFEAIPDRLTVGLGRFVAPSVVFLPIDGAHVDLSLGHGLGVQVFGGRRAITTSRRNVPLGTFHPAAGLVLSRVVPKLHLFLQGAFARDEAVFAGRAGEPYDALSLQARATALPTGDLALGGHVAFAQQATYVLGPTWADAEVEAEALDLWSGGAWVRWDATDDLALSYDLHGQRVGVWRSGVRTADGPVPEADVPGFLDDRLRADLGVVDRGFVHALARHRLRHDRQELRYGGGLHLTDLEVPGLFVKGALYLDSLFASADAAHAPAVDRLAWTGSVGWHDLGLDVEAGASAVERAANPVSGRKVDLADPTEPTVSDDLAPFVLEAQEIAFLRAFYGGRSWFGGLDVERSLRDGEWRVYLQVGALGRVRW